jgi:TRAP-type C4-dicarboxylate transport system permease small subunit
MASTPPSRPPRWYAIPIRAGVITFIATLLCFAVSLLFAILGTVIVASLHSVRPDMRVAYRHIALPIALVAGSIIFVLALIAEIRHYRQARTLTAIERISSIMPGENHAR